MIDDDELIKVMIQYFIESLSQPFPEELRKSIAYEIAVQRFFLSHIYEFSTAYYNEIVTSQDRAKRLLELPYIYRLTETGRAFALEIWTARHRS